jgi:group I intron endonuclease
LEEREYTVDYIVENGIDKKAYGFIYVTTNLINGKKYIGQKRFDKDNKWEKYIGSGKYLKKAIKKYGRGNFTKKIIVVSYSKDDLNTEEINIISSYNAVDDINFYNIANGGQGSNGFKGGHHTDETKIKISNSLKGVKNHNYGKIFSEETRKKLSRSLKGKMNGESNSLYGKKHTEQTKELLKQLHIGKKLSSETKQKLSIIRSGIGNSMFGKTHTKEAREKISKAHKGIPLSENHRLQISINNTGANNPKSKEIICLTTGKHFNYIKEASQYYGIEKARNQISSCCKGKRKSAGKYPETGEPLRWMYYEDYIAQQNNNMKEIINE